MTLKTNQSVKQIVWFKRLEELEILNWVQNEIKVSLAPNMAVRYLCMKALQDKKLRKRATERINLMFEENAAKGKRHILKCCEDCDFSDWWAKNINKHRSECDVYQKLVKDRMDRLISAQEVVIKN